MKKMQTINYAKYSNMSERQLLNSLLNAEKKEAKLKADLQEKIKNTNELINFLRTKLKEKIDKPRYDFIALEQTQGFKNYTKRLAQMSEIERDELKAEVEADINRDYNEL